jgi:hypothetical protein
MKKPGVARIVICLPAGSVALCSKTMPNAAIYGKENHFLAARTSCLSPTGFDRKKCGCTLGLCAIFHQSHASH